MDPIAFVTVDVFTDARFGGNPLAVIPDARGLDDATMQRLAVEFNYSESTFVLPPEDPVNTARVRIFSPGGELPFAGHPNVGTAFVLARAGHAFGRPLGDALRFEEQAGLVAVDLLRENGAVVGARIRAPQPAVFGPDLDPGPLAACLSLTAADIRTDRHALKTASVGLPFAMVELATLDALARSRPNAAACHGAAGDTFSIYLYARIGENPRRVRSRMFAPFDGIAEDPATGSAAAALGALLASLEPTADGQVAITVEQGVERGRPSRIDVTAEVARGAVRSVSIAGRCVPVMRGKIDLAAE